MNKKKTGFLSPEAINAGVDAIITFSSLYYGHTVTREDLFSKNRSQPVVLVRAVLSKLLHESGMSFLQIGKVIGRDHTSAMNLVERFSEIVPEEDADDILEFVSGRMARIETDRRKALMKRLSEMEGVEL